MMNPRSDINTWHISRIAVLEIELTLFWNKSR
jgi:hypothetical protein